MKLTIDRTRWYRGKSAVDSALLRDDGTMCCLGFLGLACEIPAAALLARKTPLRVNEAYRHMWPADIFGRHLSTLLSLNDRVNLSDRDREDRLIKEFHEIGVEVEFVG